ncbi:MAG: stage II sporulation protein M [Gemmatimonadaceae bacterium]|nr:stage II sporulation protein M [Gemmatimonadaceae bacterium]
MTSPARAYEHTVDVETPELVVISYSIAGVGSRVLAALTDLAICFGTLLVVLVAVAVLDPSDGPTDGLSASWAMAFLILVQFAILWGYYVLFEGLMDGQTPGKRIHRLRVVREGGFSVTFAVSAVRNLVRIVDMQPVFFYLAGLGSILLTRRGQRLGDIVAGTLVVREAVRTTAGRLAASPHASSSDSSAADAPALQTALSEEEFRILGQVVSRWDTLDASRRDALARGFADHLGEVLPDDGRALRERLLALHAQEQRARARGVSSRGETGAGRERQALIAANAPRWERFATLLATAQRRGLRALGEAGVREFVGEYRALSADLARLRTAAGGHALDELFQLGRLVAGAHNLLYRDRGVPFRTALAFLFSSVPREIRRSAAPIALAALLLFGPAIVAAVAVANTPGLAALMLPDGMLRRADDGVRRARNGEGYIDDPQLFRPVMASSIVANNVQVSFLAFAGGVTGGLLTALLIVVNGISLGSVVGLYVSKGIGSLLLAFVAPHGVLELFAICVAAGAGFLIAAALLLPGARTRREALAEQSRRAIRLIGASTLLLLVAGLLEGLVSPIEWWPLEGKLAVSGTTLVLLVLYLRGGRAPSPAPVTTTSPASLALGAVRLHRAP